MTEPNLPLDQLTAKVLAGPHSCLHSLFTRLYNKAIPPSFNMADEIDAGIEAQVLSVEAAAKHFDNLQTAIDASISALNPLLTKARNDDPSLDMASGLSLLLVRPSILLSSLHHLVLSLAFTLSGQQPSDPSGSSALNQLFGDLSAARADLDVVSGEAAQDELLGELAVNQEVLDKVRGMESKLEYQIKKLTALAEAEEKRGDEVVNEVEEDPLSFRPNIGALASTSAAAEGSGSSKRGQRAVDRNEDEDEDEASGGVYRPPRVAAMPYNEPNTKSRKERRAPALLSEFASTLEGAPGLETTSGLSTNPVRADRHSNSASAKRAAELKRINEFEEENMTRLVTTKREAKRRREDEEALALGYGVGGTGRSRGNRQNGLEAELEGVLGERRSGGIWDGVGKKLGARGDMFERGKRGVEARGDGARAKKARFDKDVKGRSGKRK